MKRFAIALSTISIIVMACSFAPRVNLPGGAATATGEVTQRSETPATIEPVVPTPIVQVISELEDLYVNLYERLSPSVVHITSRTQAFDFFRGETPQEGTGSGFVYDDQGHIVTNQHVIAGADSVEVVFADGTTAKANIVGSDVYNDLAVLKVDKVPANARPLTLGVSSALKVGMRVIAIGNPFGLDRTLTTGVISALGRTIERESEAALGEMIQTDAAINPGNSGGPLLNLRGELIGVNSNIRSPSGGSVGIGFAVPVDTLKRVLPDLISKGKYEHPWLGFNAYEIDSDLADLLKLPVQKGLLIAQLAENGSAERAGVKGASERVRTYGGNVLAGGDILTAIDDQPIATRDSMVIYLENNKRPGNTVILSLIRDGKELTLTATLDPR